MRKRVLLVLFGTLLAAERAHALDRSLYVINGLAETLSRVNLQTGAVSNNILALGLVPNQIFIDNEVRRDGVAYVLNSSSDDLQMVQLEPTSLLKTIPLGADRNPYSLAFLNDSVVAVTNLVANSISEVNTRSGVVDTEYQVGQAPEGLVSYAGGLWVCLTAFDFGTFAYGQGQLALVNPDSNKVEFKINVGTNPQAVLVDFEGEILVLCTGDFFSAFGMIYVIDPDSWLVTDSVATGNSPGHMALAPDGLVYIAAGGWSGNGEVYLFNSHTNTMVRNASNPVAVGTGAVAAAADIFANGYSCGFAVDQVNRIASGASAQTYSVGDGPGFGAVYEPNPAGDVDANGQVTTSDIIFLVNYLFKAGAAPASLGLADVNRNCQTSVSDVVSIVNYVFRNGKRLQYGCW